ncbi:MAG: hypothetical protein U0641_12645 [Anaerolineae bacterium]
MLRFLGTDRSQRVARAIDSVCIVAWTIGFIWLLISEYGHAFPILFLPLLALISAGVAAWRWERVGGAALAVAGIMVGSIAVLLTLFAFFFAAGEAESQSKPVGPIIQMLLPFVIVVALLLGGLPILDGLLFLLHSNKVTSPPAVSVRRKEAAMLRFLGTNNNQRTPWDWKYMDGQVLVVAGLIIGGAVFLALWFIFMLGTSEGPPGNLAWQDVAAILTLFLTMVVAVPIGVGALLVAPGIYSIRRAARKETPAGDWSVHLARAVSLAGIGIWACSLLRCTTDIWLIAAAICFIVVGLVALHWERVAGPLLVILGALLGGAILWFLWRQFGLSPRGLDRDYIVGVLLASALICFLAVPPIVDGALFLVHARRIAAPPSASVR